MRSQVVLKMSAIALILPKTCYSGPFLWPSTRSRELKITKVALLLKALAQWYISWHYQLMAWVQTPGTKPKGIMYLLVGVQVGVQALPW